MKNKAAPHQTDSIDIDRLPSVIHPCNYHYDEDDHDHDEDDHDVGFKSLVHWQSECGW